MSITKTSQTMVIPNAPDRILAEQLKLLFKALPLSLAGSILIAGILVVVLWQVVNHKDLLLWLGISLFITALRGLCLYHYRRKPPTSEAQQQTCLRYFLLSTLLAGLAWGGVSLWLFPPESVPHQAFIAFGMAGISAAGIISLSYIRQIALAFVLPVLLPLIGQFLLLQTDMSIAMGLMGSLFLLIALAGIRRNYEDTRQNITLRLESVEHEKTILESQQKLALHVQQTPLAVIEWSTDYRVTDWNPAAETIFGYKKGEAIGKHASDLIVPDEAKPLLSDAWSSLLRQRGSLQSTNDNVTKDGYRITCDWYNTPLINKQGKVIGVASLAHDVSERLRIEKIQSDFISTVSHELRTPLTSISGAMGLLTAKALEPGSDEYDQLLEIASNNTERLLLIINDILDIQKIESGKMDFDIQPVALFPFLQQAVDSNKTYADQHHIQLQLHPAREFLIVRADPNRLMQVMYNLLSNAAKFSRPGQTTEISMQRHNDMGRIIVSDHGRGIEDEFIDQVFERFARGDSSNTRTAGGTGLGLSIVKNIIEQHDGEISFDSQAGRGTRFYVDLPLI